MIVVYMHASTLKIYSDFYLFLFLNVALRLAFYFQSQTQPDRIKQ